MVLGSAIPLPPKSLENNGLGVPQVHCGRLYFRECGRVESSWHSGRESARGGTSPFCHFAIWSFDQAGDSSKPKHRESTITSVLLPARVQQRRSPAGFNHQMAK